MNKIQRSVLFFTALLVILMLIFPPYEVLNYKKMVLKSGYGFIFELPKYRYIPAKIDVSTLLIQVFVTLIASGSIVLASRSIGEGGSKKRDSSSESKNEVQLELSESTTSSLIDNLSHRNVSEIEDTEKSSINYLWMDSSGEKYLYAKVIDGDYGLAKTYWLFGIVATLIFQLFASSAQDVRNLSFLLLLYVVYESAVLIGTWKAANKYTGLKIWVILAKLSTILRWGGVAFGCTFLFKLWSK